MSRGTHNKPGLGPVGTLNRTCVRVHVRDTPVQGGAKEHRRLVITKELVLHVRALQMFARLRAHQIAERLGIGEQHVRRMANPASNPRWLPERAHLTQVPEVQWETWVDEVAAPSVTGQGRGDGRANRSEFSNELVLYARALSDISRWPDGRIVSHLQEDLKIDITYSAVLSWLRGTSRTHLRRPTPADLSFPTTLKGHTYVPNHHLEEVQPQPGLAALAVREEP